MMAPWRSGMLSMIWLVAVSAAQASAPTVSVSLSGPDEGWCGDSLYYSASGEYNVDGATQQEIRDGEATVDVEYLWSYSPAECLSGGGTHDRWATLRYLPECGGQTHTVSVTYTVTISYGGGPSDVASAEASKEVYIKMPTVEIEDALTHDYIVPFWVDNRIRFTMGPEGVESRITGWQVLVKDNADSVVRMLSGACTDGLNDVRWDGCNAIGGALTEDGSPYSYTVRLCDPGGYQYVDELGSRLIKEWSLSFVICDRSYPEADFESGVDEDTIADNGSPVALGVWFGPENATRIFYVDQYNVTPDYGDKGWDALVELSEAYGMPCLLYTTPTTSVPPAARYHVYVWHHQPYVRDVAGNIWDMDETTDACELATRWQFGISPTGELIDFEASYQ